MDMPAPCMAALPPSVCERVYERKIVRCFVSVKLVKHHINAVHLPLRMVTEERHWKRQKPLLMYCKVGTNGDVYYMFLTCTGRHLFSWLLKYSQWGIWLTFNCQMGKLPEHIKKKTAFQLPLCEQKTFEVHSLMSLCFLLNGAVI